MSDFSKLINQAVEAARSEGLSFAPQASHTEKEALTENVGEASPDSTVQEHLDKIAAEDTSAEILRMTKMAVYAILTAGDSLLAVERCQDVRRS